MLSKGWPPSQLHPGAIAAFAKWFIEETKMMAARGHTIGIVLWNVADYVSLLLGRTILSHGSSGKAA
jgi:hypothetical protein